MRSRWNTVIGNVHINVDVDGLIFRIFRAAWRRPVLSCAAADPLVIVVHDFDLDRFILESSTPHAENHDEERGEQTPTDALVLHCSLSLCCPRSSAGLIFFL
jgi:hypothetical protein